MERSHDWDYQPAADIFVCSRCAAATDDPPTHEGYCVEPGAEAAAARRQVDELLEEAQELEWRAESLRHQAALAREEWIRLTTPSDPEAYVPDAGDQYQAEADEVLAVAAEAHRCHRDHTVVVLPGYGWVCEVCDEDAAEVIEDYAAGRIDLGNEATGPSDLD